MFDFLSQDHIHLIIFGIAYCFVMLLLRFIDPELRKIEGKFMEAFVNRLGDACLFKPMPEIVKTVYLLSVPLLIYCTILIFQTANSYK